MLTIQKMISDLNEVGISQTELEKLTGSSQSTISRVLNGKTKPTYEFGKAIESLHRQKVPNENPTAA